MKNVKYFYSCLILIVLSLNGINAQELISYEKILSMTKEKISANYFVDAKYDVDVYKIIYTTHNINMIQDTVSGIISIALDMNSSFPVMVYDHGTVGNRHDVPSEGSSEMYFTIAFASLGYHCVAPDYIGLGVSKGLHPYIHPETEAIAGVDLIYAVKNLVDTENIHFNDQIFVTGYSQGGHAAMATARELKNFNDLNLTAVAPMSGPYSVSREMKNFTMGDENYYFCGYIGSVALTVIKAYPNLMQNYNIEDIFKPDYSRLIRKFENEQMDLFAVNDSMIYYLGAKEGKILPKLMFKDEVRGSILYDDDFVFNKALKRMDVCDWVPQKPVKMLYCKGDDQVTYRNAVYTDSLMNAKGAAEVSSKDVFSIANHSTCILPAIKEMLTFFGQYQQINTLAVQNGPVDSIETFPNPAKDFVYIRDADLKNLSFKIFDYTGNLLINSNKNISNKIDISSLSHGVYILVIKGLGKQKVVKLVK